MIPILCRICDTIPKKPSCFFTGTTFDRSVVVVIRPGLSAVE